MAEASTRRPNTPLQIIYDANDPKCVRRKVHDDRTTYTRYWVGVHNAASDRTLFNVSLRASESEFAGVLAIAHGRFLNPSSSVDMRVEREPLLAEWNQLDPDVTEYVELLGLDDKPSPYDRDEVLKIIQQFTLEARATNTKRAVALFEYNPAEMPMIRRVEPS